MILITEYKQAKGFSADGEGTHPLMAANYDMCIAWLKEERRRLKDG